MLCVVCNSENPPNAKFCVECGTAFNTQCPNCGGDNLPRFKFCAQCGAALSSGAANERRAISAVKQQGDSKAAAERRHLTVLFCDLVDSTRIAARLDPEEWRDIVGTYHRQASAAITRVSGHIAKFLGDGVMAFFGYPTAHDNDAERAGLAGLALVEEIEKINRHSAPPKLSIRVGIHSGPVVVAAGIDQDADVFGDTPNIAARVQEIAGPNTVLMTADAFRLVPGLFVVENQGPQRLKGVDQPTQLYRLLRPSGVRGRLVAAAAERGLTAFVGRAEELRLLMSRWERVLESEGQVATIVGEAGIGKSRLLKHFNEQIAPARQKWIETSAAALSQNTPFYPVCDLLKQLIGRHANETGEQQLLLLQNSLESLGLDREATSLIGSLLSLPLPASYPPSTLSPEQRRRRLLDTLVEWLLAVARVQPLVVAIDDLHWADPSTLELIQLLVEQTATAPLFLLLTARPEFQPHWPLRAHHTQITLNRLSSRNVRTMVGEIAAQRALSDEAVGALIERTGGVPLFVEELTRALLDNGAARMATHDIPATLHDSLMARLDRLGPAKEIVQVGAVNWR